MTQIGDKNSKHRFSDRVADYVKYRPNYPAEIINFLEKEGILENKTFKIADIGSGTGILTKLFLEKKYTIYGIEPNDEMRRAGESYLQKYKNFISINGSAEVTTLGDQSVDVITAGQAYHWFNPKTAKQEFKRILKTHDKGKPNTVLVWNTRVEKSAFDKNLEELIVNFSTDYKEVSHTQDKLKDKNIFFEDIEFKKNILDNKQIVAYDGLLGRLLSSSYMIKKEDEKYPQLEQAVKKLFEKFQKDGFVTINYETEVYIGTI